MRAFLAFGVLVSLAGACLASETITYQYDALGRLIKVARTGTVNAGANACYTYDPANNRTNVTTSPSADCTPGGGGGGGPPSFSINDVSATEGGSLVFTVTKTGTTASSFSVNFASANGTATAGTDYTANSGTLVFASTDTTKPVTITTTDDASVESSETVLVNLSGATGGATITDAQGVGTILDNDSGGNNPPVAVNDTGSQQRCTDATYNVVANDTDPDGDYPLTVISVTGNRFSVVSSTSIQYSALQNGGTGTYTVRDSRGATSTATLAISVSGTCS